MTLKTLSFLALFPLLLFGCVGHQTPQALSQKLERISLVEDIYIDLTDLFPLPFKGVYLQQLISTFANQQHQFSVHLTLEPTSFKAVAFNDIAGQLYTLVWTQETLEWTTSSFIPKHIQPHRILADFLMAHLPLKILQKHLQGAIVTEEKGTRFIRKNHKLVREIILKDPLKDLGGEIILKNPILPYQLDIKTVMVP